MIEIYIHNPSVNYRLRDDDVTLPQKYLSSPLLGCRTFVFQVKRVRHGGAVSIIY